MLKRGGLLVAALLLVGSLFFLSNSTGASAAGNCCTSSNDCLSDEYCNWPGGWKCLLFGQCTSLWPDQCGQIGYANDCTGDAICGSGKYCSIGTKSAYVAADHTCKYVSANECKSCAYPSADCDYSGGCETNLATSGSNCGSCGNKCDPTYGCQSGSCTPPPPKCTDADRDKYQVPLPGFSASDCTTQIGCNDANAAVMEA